MVDIVELNPSASARASFIECGDIDEGKTYYEVYPSGTQPRDIIRPLIKALANPRCPADMIFVNIGGRRASISSLELRLYGETGLEDLFVSNFVRGVKKPSLLRRLFP